MAGEFKKAIDPFTRGMDVQIEDELRKVDAELNNVLTKSLNLCNNCGAIPCRIGGRPAYHHGSDTCIFWEEPGVPAVKGDRAGTDTPSAAKTEPGSLLSPSPSPEAGCDTQCSNA
jgi:hypothetical protein